MVHPGSPWERPAARRRALALGGRGATCLVEAWGRFAEAGLSRLDRHSPAHRTRLALISPAIPILAISGKPAYQFVGADKDPEDDEDREDDQDDSHGHGPSPSARRFRRIGLISS